MAIKKHDFVELGYTGKLKEDNTIYDTTDEKIAKENDIFNEKQTYGSVIVCVGENQILAGIDEQLEGKEAEKSYTIELAAENAFGKKNAKLIQLINTSKFRKQGVTPMPGLQVNIDGMMGLVRTVSGGRTIVDFNHPLAGKDVVYDIKIGKIITDDKKKIEEYVKLQLNVKDITVSLSEGNAKIEVKSNVFKEVEGKLSDKIKELIPSVKKVEFVEKKEPKEVKKVEESKKEEKKEVKEEKKNSK